MPLFLLKFNIVEGARSDCMTLFGGMTEADDKADMGSGIELIGRWSTLGEGAGYCVCRADNAKTLGNWLANWLPMVTITVVPVVDDNEARRIILGSEPDYTVDYSRAGDAPTTDDESLYLIKYAFKPGCKAQGFEMFASLSEEMDRSDAGENTTLGRWHDLATGTGVAVCLSKSSSALQAWAHNWKDLCDCSITPVLSDAEFRSIVQAKPGFVDKRTVLMKKMAPSSGRRWWSS